MKVQLLIIPLVLMATIFDCSKEQETTGVHTHHDDHNAKTNLSKPPKRFIADDSLRVHMSVVLNTMKAMHSSGVKVSLAETGLKIESTVQDIFKKCKLEPEADAAIHPILAELLKGASLFKNGQEKSGQEIIHNALLRYETFFEHPGWGHLD